MQQQRQQTWFLVGFWFQNQFLIDFFCFQACRCCFWRCRAGTGAGRCAAPAGRARGVTLGPPCCVVVWRRRNCMLQCNNNVNKPFRITVCTISRVAHCATSSPTAGRAATLGSAADPGRLTLDSSCSTPTWLSRAVSWAVDSETGGSNPC